MFRFSYIACVLILSNRVLMAGNEPVHEDGFESPALPLCATETMDMRMLWDSCAPGIDCFEDGGQRWLHLPTVGPVTEEGHLVTSGDGFGGGWPVSQFDQISNHYLVSENASEFMTTRDEGWVPAGESGSEFGQGASGAYVPVLDEAWYISMFWADRPSIGTRMIVSNPVNGLAVVASAGLNTAPAANSRIAGVPEEIHAYLQSSHADDLEIGFATNQNLPLGPVTCN